MKVFYCNDFKGVQPTSTAAIVVAANKTRARQLLDTQLKSQGLPGLRDEDKVQELDSSKSQVIVLADGDY